VSSLCFAMMIQDMYGNTALDYAAGRGVLSHVEYLCSLPTTTRAHKEHALFSAVTATGSGVFHLCVYPSATTRNVYNLEIPDSSQSTLMFMFSVHRSGRISLCALPAFLQSALWSGNMFCGIS
jgi:hypothetical protein